MSTKAMVIFSGGQDSTTCLYWAREMYHEVRAITFNYAQKHFIELDAARKIGYMAGIKHEFVDVPGVLRSHSPLTDPKQKLETYKNYEEMDTIIGNRVEVTFVPMRNAFFLTLAANRALYYDIYNLVTGVCQQDNANYPDCRQSFIKQQEITINQALGVDSFRIHTPLMDLTKAETVRLSKSMPGCWDALSYSHTCYAGQAPPCGSCHSCTLRAQGFKEAGYPDPLIQRFEHEPI